MLWSNAPRSHAWKFRAGCSRMPVSSDRIPKVGVGRWTPQEVPGGIYTCTAYSEHMVVISRQWCLRSWNYTFHVWIDVFAHASVKPPPNLNLWAQPEIYDAWTVWLDHMCCVNTAFVLIQFPFEFWPCWMIPHPEFMSIWGALRPYTQMLYFTSVLNSPIYILNICSCFILLPSNHLSC